MRPPLKPFLWCFWSLAVIWPWTALPWRAFSIPCGALLIVAGSLLAARASGRSAAEAALEGLEALDLERCAWLLAALFFVALSSLKLCQFVSFQSHYGDLGQDANICWNTLHGRPFLDSLTGSSFLGDHFEPVLALCALPMALWPSAAVLLLIQCLGLALAVVPLLALGRLCCRRQAPVLALGLLFMLNPFLHLVSEFDFHPEALFIPAALWALLFWRQGRLLPAGLLALGCLGLKEDASLALGAFGLYAAWFERRRAGGVLAAACAAAFALVALWAIPHFAGSRVSLHHDRYASLGLTTGAMIRNVAWHPWVIPLRLLRPRVLGTGVMLLASTGFLPLAAPAALAPVLGACLHHLLSDYRSQYCLVSQYAAQTLPFLFYAALQGLGAWEERLWAARGRVAALFVVLCGATLLLQPYYSGGFRWRDVLEAARLVRQVPERAPLLTDGAHGRGNEDLLVHLALRQSLGYLDASRSVQAPAGACLLVASGRGASLVPGAFTRVAAGDGLELWRRLEEHR